MMGDLVLYCGFAVLFLVGFAIGCVVCGCSGSRFRFGFIMDSGDGGVAVVMRFVGVVWFWLLLCVWVW